MSSVLHKTFCGLGVYTTDIFKLVRSTIQMFFKSLIFIILEIKFLEFLTSLIYLFDRQRLNK